MHSLVRPHPALRRAGRYALSLLAAIGALLPAAGPLQAQDSGVRESTDWRIVAELAGSLGGTWLEGPRAPTVASKPGVLLGLGLQRGWTEFVAAGAIIRAAVQPIEIRESGETWSGGTLAESQFLANLSLQSRRRTMNRLSLDLSGGAAILTGANRILPFEDAKSLAPLLEVGIAFRRGNTDADASRKDLALVLRYNMLKVQSEVVNTIATSGWVGRVVAGVRVTR